MANVGAVLLDLRAAAAGCGPEAFPDGIDRLDERLAKAAARDLALPQERIKKAFGAARAVLRRHGGASLLKHLRKSNAALTPGHPAWDELDYFEKRKDNMRYGES